MNPDAFSSFHPLVNLIFFAAVLGMTMCIQHPVYLMITWISGCSYLFYLRGRQGMLRQLRYLLPVFLLTAWMNPMFHHEGVTVLWYLPNDNPVTWEAVCFGLAAAVMMGASILWFHCCSIVFTSDKILYLSGRLMPSIALLLSMSLRFVPRFQNYLKRVIQAQQAMDGPEHTGQKLQQALASFSATVSWAMEQSIVSADSMKSRGWGLPGRTFFSIYTWERRDGLVLVLLLLLCAGGSIPCITGHTAWKYYPALTGELSGPVPWVGYLSYSGMCILPLIIDWMEECKWNSLRSKI